jgi:hypothetical protein
LHSSTTSGLRSYVERRKYISELLGREVWGKGMEEMREKEQEKIREREWREERPDFYREFVFHSGRGNGLADEM